VWHFYNGTLGIQVSTTTYRVKGRYYIVPARLPLLTPVMVPLVVLTERIAVSQHGWACMPLLWHLLLLLLLLPAPHHSQN